MAAKDKVIQSKETSWRVQTLAVIRLPGVGGVGGVDTLTCPGDKLSVVPLNTSATLPTPGTVRHLHALHGRQELNSHRTGPTVSTAPALSWATLSSLSSSSLLLPSLAGI